MMPEFTDPGFEAMLRSQLLTKTIPPLKPCIVVSDHPLEEGKWFAFFLTDTPAREVIERSILAQAGIEP